MTSLRQSIIEQLSTEEGKAVIIILVGAILHWIRVNTRPIRNKKYRRQTRGRRESDRVTDP